MNNKKTEIRFFTIADYEEEEKWLHDQHKNGWKMVKMIPPCFFIFEKCEPAEVTYRLDYKNNSETSNYFQLFKDYGWEYIGHCVGWLYFRKSSSEMDSERDGEIFSDNESRVDMIDHVIKTRLLPIMIIFLCCILPNLMNSIETYGSFTTGFTVFFSVMTLLYIYMIVYCSLKLRKLREKYRTD